MRFVACEVAATRQRRDTVMRYLRSFLSLKAGIIRKSLFTSLDRTLVIFERIAIMTQFTCCVELTCPFFLLYGGRRKSQKRFQSENYKEAGSAEI
jgi:hypothetical protein